MKLFGNKKKSQRRHGGVRPAYDQYPDREHTQEVSGKRKKRKKSRLKRVLITILVIILVLAAALAAVYLIFVRPPDVNMSRRDDGNTPQDSTGDGSSEVTDTRDLKKYTFLLLGQDDGNGNTDTMMVATFDTAAHTLNVVSIPRDTLVNVSWPVKKANTLYSYTETMDEMNNHLADILGYKVDFYVIVDLEAFEILIDEIGGVYYDVPVDMQYSDPGQDLYIDIKAGPQMLSGADALKVVRFRSGYANADIGRIDTQQDFLKTAAEQILANKNSLSLSSLANVFLNYVETDLDYGEVIWFAQEFMKINGADITFHTLPGNYGGTVYQGGQWVSYVMIYPDEWLEMVNTYLNPFEEEITLDDVSILTEDENGTIYSTNDYYADDPNWGNYY